MGLTGNYIPYELVFSEPFSSSVEDNKGNITEELISTSSYEAQPPIVGAYVNLSNVVRGKEKYDITGSEQLKKSFLEVGYKVYNSYEDRLNDINSWVYDIIPSENLELSESNINLWDKGYEFLLTLPSFVSMSQD